MPLDLFSDDMYVQFNELYKRYKEELYSHLKEINFITSNEHWLTRHTKQSQIGITIFDTRCIDDSNYPNREEWREMSLYQIEFRPHEVKHRFMEDYNEDNFNINELDQDYKMYCEVKNYIANLFKEYKTEYEKIKAKHKEEDAEDDICNN